MLNPERRSKTRELDRSGFWKIKLTPTVVWKLLIVCHTQFLFKVGVTHKFFPARESLVSDTPAGDGKIDKLFYSVMKTPHWECRLLQGERQTPHWEQIFYIGSTKPTHCWEHKTPHWEPIHFSIITKNLGSLLIFCAHTGDFAHSTAERDGSWQMSSTYCRVQYIRGHTFKKSL